MNKYFILGLLLCTAMGTLTTTAQCACDQLIAQGDCERQPTLGCKWNETKKVCAKDTSTPTQIVYATYCEKYNETDCPQKDGCLYYATKCTHFTGCTAFNKTTDQDCAAISKNCKTDGIHCVEISTCSSYVKQSTCTTNRDGAFCFWDASVTPNACIDPSKCEHYPTSLTTDEQCRAKKFYCTAKTGGGCQDSGTQCSDQPGDLQCKWNYARNTKCFWDTSVTPNVCKDKICTNAPKSYNTDQQCIDHDSSCTTAKDGGCVTRTTCEQAQNAAACKTNSSGGPCYYTSTNTCVTKDCSAAPTSNTTNTQCAAWVTGLGCITKLNGGCKPNGTCSAADVEAACSVNSLGGACIWNNGKCLDKTCTNAPSTYNSHPSCSQYNLTCTVNSTSNGCTDRTCDNAPKDVATNSACNTYKSGCITKKDGGCRKNTNCSDFDIDIACESTIDSTGNKCFWDSTATPAGCLAKTCANAPSASRVSHSACNLFLPNCTVNKEKTACIEMTCENIQDKDDCKKDKDSNTCLYKATCFQIQCSQALDSVTTHDGCQQFMPSCTLDNDGKGCMPIPPACSVIKTQEGCVKTSSGGYNECAWSSSKCVDKICTTAPQSAITNDDCNTYKPGCLVANSEKGCIDPAITACTSRAEINCYSAVGLECLFDTTSFCIARTCATASQATIKTTNGKLSSFSNGDCGTYLLGCVVGNDGNSCIAKATTCSTYTRSDNCGKGLLNGNQCYWNSDDTCVDKQCANIKLANHNDCNNAITNSDGVGQCTYGTATNCAVLQAACGSYSEKACYVTSAGKNCIWANGSCRDKTCNDATDSADFNTHSDCQSLLTTCTVIDKVDNKGCMALKTSCGEYTNEAQCVITSSSANCYWTKSNTCILKSTLTCALIKLAAYNLTNCQNVMQSCKADGTSACTDKTCGDTISPVTDTDCSTYLSGCTNNKTNTACIQKPDLCAGQLEANCTNSKDGACTWTSPNCTKATVPKTCTNNTGTDLTWALCQAYDPTCTVNLKGDSCILNGTDCTKFDTKSKCRQYGASSFCKWSTTCVAETTVVCTDIVADADGLTYSACQAFSNTCTVNKAKTACITSKTCSLLLTGTSCFRGTDGVCYDDGTNCIAITNLTCDVVVKGSGSALTDSACSAYSTDCTALVDGSACIKKEASCSNYTAANKCVTTSDNKKCFWNAAATPAACIEITDSLCGTVLKGSSNLTDTTCAAYQSACAALVDGSACIKKETACGTYDSSNKCVTTSGGTKCYWDTTGTAACKEITNLLCETVVKGSGNALTDTACAAFQTACVALVDGSACIKKETACGTYDSSNKCVTTSGGIKCYWDTTGTAACKEITNLLCGTVVKGTGSNLTDTACAAYQTVCTALVDGTACIKKEDSCVTYDESNKCTFSAAGKKCLYATTCKDVADTACGTVTGSALTDAQCSSYNNACTALVDGTACIKKDTSCGTYNAANNCVSTSGGKKCFWNEAADPDACIEITDSICSTVVKGSGSALTDSTCSAYQSACTALVDGSACIKKETTCTIYFTANKCTITSGGKKCIWIGSTDTGECLGITDITCANVSGTGLTDTVCSAYNSACAVNSDGSACIIKKDSCGDYLKDKQCTKTSTNVKCYWDTAPAIDVCIAIVNTTCSTVLKGSGSALTDTVCSSYNSSCLANSDGSACVVKKDSCPNYGSIKECVKTSSNIKCYWNAAASPASCVAITGTNCGTVVKGGSNLTDTDCQSYNTACIAKGDGSACLKQESACGTYNLSTTCTSTTTAKCYWNTAATPNACTQISVPSDCSKVTGSGLDQTKCEAYNSVCTANAGGTACEAKSCANKKTTFTDNDCKTWNNTCVANKVTAPDGCSAIQATCLLTTVDTACVRATEGDCVWIAGTNGGLCVKKTCDTAATSLATHTACNTYLPTCTVAKIGGCIAKTDCNKYKSKTQCQNGGTCFWNERQSNTCVDLSCDKIEDAYNTDALCSGISGLKCTVKATSKGCQSRTACNLYGISDQCKLDSNNKPCFWQTVDSTSTCVDKSCATSTDSTHADCYKYITSSNNADLCTVAYVSGTAQGCQKVGACANYQYEGQCVVDDQGQDCVWSNTGSSGNCALKSCSTAAVSDSFDTNDKCAGYLDDGSCTVSSTGQGCVVRPDKCDGMSEKQCHYTSDGTVCAWFGGVCVVKTCGTAPEDVTTAAGCHDYLTGCTMEETNKCRTLNCEDFLFAIDSECEKAKKGCTTNGKNCVKRDICQAANKYGCVTQVTGEACQWVESSSICVLKTCATAPTTDDYASETQCQGYLPECTTKSGKGCVVKTTCAAATVELACTKDVSQNKCVWDGGKCRNQQCSDFSGTTHATCQGFLKGICTAGQNGKCTELGKCEAAKVRGACVEGTDGPCLWISSANNGAGACYQHYSCKSRSWNDHDQCQWISEQCTTNGTNCLAITLCSETNTNGGCRKGYDSQCIQTVSALGATDTVCKAFDKCENAFYLTHAECQNASKKCTTNTKTSCASLGACSTYNFKESCQISDAGVVKDTTGVITATGVCKWDDATSTCADQKCVDLVGSSHQSCVSQLKGCTTDGSNCLTQVACSVYTQTQCEVAYGTDGLQGKCKWDTTTTKCRPFVCGDIAEGKTTTVCQAVLSSCVSDGSVCILKDKCQVYVTKTSCNSGGTDGVCVFKASTVKDAPAGSGTCSFMTSCSSASSDSLACKQFPKKCLFTDQITTGTTTTASKCEDITSCANSAKANSGTCDFYLNWAGSQQQLCETAATGCTELDISKLTDQTCYSKSTAYTYTWNVSKCTVCTTVTTPSNNSSNGNITNGTTETESGYMLGFASIVLGYLVF